MMTSWWIIRIKSSSYRGWKGRLMIRRCRWVNCRWKMQSWGNRVLPRWRRCSRWGRSIKSWRRDTSSWKRARRRSRSSGKPRGQHSHSRRGPQENPQQQERMKDPIHLLWFLIIRAQVAMFIMKARSQLHSISMKNLQRTYPIMNRIHTTMLIWLFKVSILEPQMMLLHMLKGNSSSSPKIQVITKWFQKPRTKGLNPDKPHPKHMISL